MYILTKLYKNFSYRKQLKKWKIGDSILLQDLSTEIMFSCCESHPNNQPIAILLGWSKREVLVSFYNKQRWYINFSNFRNLSYELRNKENRVNKYMTALYEQDAKNIEKETSIEENKPTVVCNVDLEKLPLEELESLLIEASQREDYEIAAKIRDELTKRKVSNNQ